MKYIAIAAWLTLASMATAHDPAGVEPPDCADVQSTGAGCAGPGALVPSLQVGGCAKAGEPITFQIDRVAGGSGLLLLIGVQPAQVALPQGCLLQLQPALSLILPVIDLPGQAVGAAIAMKIPADMPRSTIRAQAVAFGADGINAMSNGVSALID